MTLYKTIPSTEQNIVYHLYMKKWASYFGSKFEIKKAKI